MLSISLVKGLVYGALALSMVLAPSTVVMVIWKTVRARHRRWSWAMALPAAICALAGWFWIYPSFVIGTFVGGELGAVVGHNLSPIADATVMAVGIGLGSYAVFTGPMAALAFAFSLDVTTRDAVSVRRLRPITLGVHAVGGWGAAMKRLTLVGASAVAPRVR